MNEADANRIVSVIEGNWSRLPDVRVAALTEWLRRTSATKAEVLAAIDALVEKASRYPPKPGELIEELRGAGALGSPRIGEGDPRTIARMRDDIRATANWLMDRRRLDYVTALDTLVLTYREYREEMYRVWPDEADGREDKGYWDDRLQAAISLRDEVHTKEASS